MKWLKITLQHSPEIFLFSSTATVPCAITYALANVFLTLLDPIIVAVQ